MRVLSSKRMLSTPIFAVDEKLARDPDGFEIHRLVVTHQGSSVMLPVDDQGCILLVSQYRLPVEKMLWELAAGRIDKGEKPLAAARRELTEETGLRARQWRKLATLYPTPGYVSEVMHVFVATGLTEGTATPMEDERIRTKWFSRDELEAMIDAGKLADAKTLAALLLFWRKRDRGEL